MIRTFGVVAFVCVTGLALPARAEDKSFGTPGEVVLTNGFALSLSHSSSETSHSTIQVNPTADVFVLRGFSVGGGPYYSRSWSTFDAAGESEISSDNVGAALRFGYAVNVHDSVSLWPNGGVSYYHWWWRSKLQDGPAASSDGSQVGVGAALPLLVHVTPSFFVGFGPGVSHGVSDDGTRSLYLSANTFMGGRL
jgi:hypothetical protein